MARSNDNRPWRPRWASAVARTATREDRRTRLILYLGKGGVGKTTIAAATAVRAAALGKRTLVVSTDVAHSLADVLGADLSAEPREIGDHLLAQEINVLAEVQQNWGKVRDQLVEILRREGASEIQADELAILPGMEEIAALIQIGRQLRGGSFDCIVVDAAPTGETIRLLSLPEAYQWYAGRIQEWQQRLLRFVGPLFRGAVADLQILDVIAHLADRVKELRAVLTDQRHSSYRLVVTPDRVVLKEAFRAETYLNVFDYPIDAVIVNRVLPPLDGHHAFLDSVASRQEQVIAEIQRAFRALPIFLAPWRADEPVGIPALAELAQQVFGERDPTDVLHVGATQVIATTRDGYLLKIPLPNVELAKLSLRKRGDVLYIDVGNYRRELLLPRTLAALTAGTARVRAGMLEIPFGQPDQNAGKPAN